MTSAGKLSARSFVSFRQNTGSVSAFSIAHGFVTQQQDTKIMSTQNNKAGEPGNLPPFSALPVQKPGPPLNAWGLYGPGDELGRLNLITPETVKRGKDAIVHGIAVNLK